MLTCDTCNQTFNTLFDYHCKHSNCNNPNIIKNLDLSLIQRFNKICGYIKSNHGIDPNLLGLYTNTNENRIDYYLYNNGCIAFDVFYNSFEPTYKQLDIHWFIHRINHFTNIYDKELNSKTGLEWYPNNINQIRYANNDTVNKCIIKYNNHDYFDLYKYLSINSETQYHKAYLISLLDNFGNYKGKFLTEAEIIKQLENKIKSLEEQLLIVNTKLDNISNDNNDEKIKSLEEKMLQKFKTIDDDYEYAVDHFETQFNERDNIYNLDTKLRINDLEDDMLQKNAQINAINAKLNVIYYANNVNKNRLFEERLAEKDNQIKELNTKLDNFINSQNTINNLTSQMINNFNCCS